MTTTRCLNSRELSEPESVTHVLRQMCQVLLAEKKAKGYDNRTYLRYVVALHAQALFDRRRGGESAKSPTRAK